MLVPSLLGIPPIYHSLPSAALAASNSKRLLERQVHQ
jgi:hypothetical protein